jgi:hypothetical protein
MDGIVNLVLLKKDMIKSYDYHKHITIFFNLKMIDKNKIKKIYILHIEQQKSHISLTCGTCCSYNGMI